MNTISKDTCQEQVHERNEMKRVEKYSSVLGKNNLTKEYE